MILPPVGACFGQIASSSWSPKNFTMQIEGLRYFWSELASFLKMVSEFIRF
jgi:hypothetical protein